MNETFNRLYKENYAKVYRLCLSYVSGNEALADDLAQEVFVKIWQKLDQFRNESQVSTWIYRITVNTCLMHLRKIKKSQEKITDQIPENLSSETEDGKDDRLQMLRACIQKLNEMGKILISLVLEEVPQKEIAEAVGLSNENVRVQIHRSKGKLFKCMSSKEMQNL
ncbi:RNA polymerase sigma factor [Marinifilum caeruleilacunae]|uniref:RNA polymerase sigma factor n=1 Tax=Marinifilum caeruleilacunae TaxID=2499076 RepID=A0ABX1WYP6_9BACT|nr:RNA polymerase sigma factor [Marinifilum caeruleilacunae]NOU61273.1 RNA polymerase sigma factor [Marinifilum caeruleilacunae]